MGYSKLKPVGLSPENYEKLKDFGRAGDSMNSFIKLLVLSRLGLVIVALPVVNYANAQTTDKEPEPRSLNTCYSSVAAAILLGSMFSPTNKSAMTVLLDPEVKTYLVNYCNFYHDRTGVWIGIGTADKLNQTIQEEFSAKNPPPDMLKELGRQKK